MEFSDVTEEIIGCAYRVYSVLGFGFLESVYEKSLAVEFEKVGLKANFQKPIDVFYKGQNVGNFIADVLVEDNVIVELKSVRGLTKSHEVQIVNYLAATQKPVGLLINFGENRVDIKRKVLKLPKFSDFHPVNPVNPVRGFEV